MLSLILFLLLSTKLGVTMQTGPTGPTASLTWNASTTAGVTYWVYGGAKGAEGTTPLNGTTPITTLAYSYQGALLVPGSTPCFIVKAFLPSANMFSAASNESCAQVPIGAPVQNPVQVAGKSPFNPIPLPAACLTSKASTFAFLNTPIAAQSGQFEISWTATPSANPTDGVSGLSSGPATGYANLAALLRFNPATGLIDSYDSKQNGYGVPANSVKYVKGTSVRLTIVADIGAQTYSSYANGLVIGLNYGFRTKVSMLNNMALVSETGAVTACPNTAV